MCQRPTITPEIIFAEYKIADEHILGRNCMSFHSQYHFSHKKANYNQKTSTKTSRKTSIIPQKRYA